MSDGWFDPNEDYQIIRRQLMADTAAMRDQAIETLRSNAMIDMLVAELVMGWDDPRIADRTITAYIPSMGLVRGGRSTVPAFSMDSAAALDIVVVRVHRQLGFDFMLSYTRLSQGVPVAASEYVATFSHVIDGMVHTRDRGSMARAISKAALKAAMRWRERRPEQWRSSVAPR